MRAREEFSWPLTLPCWLGVCNISGKVQNGEGAGVGMAPAILVGHRQVRCPVVVEDDFAPPSLAPGSGLGTTMSPLDNHGLDSAMCPLDDHGLDSAMSPLDGSGQS